MSEQERSLRKMERKIKLACAGREEWKKRCFSSEQRVSKLFRALKEERDTSVGFESQLLASTGREKELSDELAQLAEGNAGALETEKHQVNVLERKLAEFQGMLQTAQTTNIVRADERVGILIAIKAMMAGLSGSGQLEE